MRKWTSWSPLLSLLSIASFSSVLMVSRAVSALSEQEIMQKLRPIPVFTIVDNQGSLLVTTEKSQTETTSVVFVFISRQDAQSYIEQEIKPFMPQVTSQAKVRAVSLAEIYQLQEESSSYNGLRYKIIPEQSQVQQAEVLLRQGIGNQEEVNFPGVPLFMLGIKLADETGDFPTISIADNRIPLFFEKEAAEKMLNKLKQIDSEQNQQLEIIPTSLTKIIHILKNEDSKTGSHLAFFTASQEALEFLRTLQ